MMRIPYLALGMALLAQTFVNCWGQETQKDRLTVSPADFTVLDGARVVDVEGTASGKAVLVEEPDGLAAVVVKSAKRAS